MKIKSSCVVLALALCLPIGCDSKDDGKTKAAAAGAKKPAKTDKNAKSGKTEKPKEAKPAVKKPAAPKLDFTAFNAKPEGGYEGEFNKIMGSWTYEKWVPADDGTNDVGGRFYADPWDDSKPQDADAYAKKLTVKDWLDMTYVWNKAEKAEELPNGWVIKGEAIDYSDKEAKPELAFAARVAGLSCHGSGFMNEELRTQAIATCKALVSK